MSAPSTTANIRALSTSDLGDIVRIDARVVGRPRPKFLEAKLGRALNEGVQMSLCAEVDGHVVGFLMGQVFYGEFGQAEPVASIDTLGVDPDYWKRGVGRALWNQFAANLKALRIVKIHTQVDWTNWSLLRFLEKVGFMPAPRLCLERTLDPTKDESVED